MGVHQLGQAAGQLTDAAVDAYQKYQHEERSRQSSEAMTELSKRVTDIDYGTAEEPDTSGPVPDIGKMSTEEFSQFLAGPPRKQTEGFLSTRGEHALSSLDPSLKAYDDAKKKIAAGMTDAQARKMFEQAAAPLMLHQYQQAHSHVAHQIQVAKEDQKKAARAEANRAVAVNPGDDAWAHIQVGAAAGAAIGLTTSDQDAAHEVDEIRSDIAETRAKMLMTDTADRPADYQKALEVVKANEHALGEKARPLLDAIAGKQAVAEAQVTATKLVDAALGADGQVNQTAFLDGLKTVEPLKRKTVSDIGFRLIGEREQAFAADTKRISDDSFAVYNTQGWAALLKHEAGKPKELQLNTRNPPLYNRIHDDWMNELERGKRIARGTKEDQQRQVEINHDAIEAFKALPPDLQRGTDIGQFLVGRGTGGVHAKEINPVVNELKVWQQKAVNAHEKGMDVPINQFVEKFASDAFPFRPLRPGREGDKERKAYDQRVKADALDVWTQAQGKHPDNAPTQAELDALKGPKLLDYKFNPTDPKQMARKVEATIQAGGGIAAPRAVTPSGESTPPKKVKSYLLSPDSKQRVPVYEDGTRGTPEPVR